MAAKPKNGFRNRRLRELAAIGLLFLAFASLLALASYDHADPTWARSNSDGGPVRNWIGSIGAHLAEALLQLCGLTAFAVPPLLAVVGWRWLRHRPLALDRRTLGYGVLCLATAALLSLLYGSVLYGGESFSAGGVFGDWTSAIFVSLFARLGAILFAVALIAAMIVLTTRFSFARAADAAGPLVAAAGRGAWRSGVRRLRGLAASGKSAPRTPKVERAARPRPKPAPKDEDDRSPAPAGAGEDAPAVGPPPVRRREPIPVNASTRAEDAPPEARPAGQQARSFAAPEYRLPPLDLLAEPKEQSIDNEKELRERASQLTEKFREFNVDGTVVAIHPGPVVTTFEFKPEAGVKYSKITGMSDDLCLALRAESVRIDRIPGRSTVGIEVPNRRQETIYMRELLEGSAFQDSASKLTLSLGKDIGGTPAVAQLEKMPHLLIAGATGAGKSVMLNGIITSILYKATPPDVRLIMIDTKMIELGVYADIPHLLIPVVTDPKLASTALKWAVREMEARYKKLAAVGVRNLEQFNELLRDEPDRTMPAERSGEPVPLEPMPFIVIVIDEMADLMMVSSADVEESVMRLAQMARAVGIHLILATQRPSVDVITGTIKANFPSRIAFRVSQRVDSRTIIDQNGAQQLLGRGDMLYLATGSSRLRRLHSGFITEKELNRVTDFLKETAKPVYDESVLKDPEEERSAGGYEGERDSMYGEAVRLILSEGTCSITLIQRRLRLGYARAARIVDMMEQEGVIGPADGSRPRELLVGSDYLDAPETPPP